MICSSLYRLFFIFRLPFTLREKLQLQVVEISGGRSPPPASLVITYLYAPIFPVALTLTKEQFRPLSA
jgi:hypothetical protein